MFRRAIVRTPCPGLVNGLSTANLGLPQYATALEQHARYVQALRECELVVVELSPVDEFPDSVFVEDPALCTPRCAVVTRPGAESRRDEADLLVPTLKRFYEHIERIVSPGTLDAGDVMMVGDHYFIGHSARTNLEGAQQLVAILNRYEMEGSIIALREVLHLKTGLAYLENDHLLVSGEFVSHPAFQRFNRIEISTDESYAANCIWVNGRVIMPLGFPRTYAKISSFGYQIIEIDTSEFRKLDGGISCMSLRF